MILLPSSLNAGITGLHRSVSFSRSWGSNQGKHSTTWATSSAPMSLLFFRQYFILCENSRCNPNLTLNSLKPSCFSLLSAVVIRINYHVWLRSYLIIFNNLVMFFRRLTLNNLPFEFEVSKKIITLKLSILKSIKSNTLSPLINSSNSIYT